MPLSPEQIILGHRAALALVRSRVKEYAATAWAAQGSYRDADIDRLVSLIVPRVQAGQIQTASLTSAYIASIASLRLGRTVKAVPVPRAAILGARGVDPDEVYRRPATVVYTALSQGAAFRDAVALGALRLGQLVAMDMQMSQVRQSRESYQRSGVQHFRRVLQGGKNCELCIAAADQPYWSGDLMPIHGGCACTTEPSDEGSSTGTFDIGPLADPEVRVEVREHGEYGPVLTYAGQHFTGPDDLTN